MPRIARILTAASAVLLTLPAAAQFQKPADAVEYRQSAFTVMGTHFARIGAMANNKVPFDAKAVQANADIVATMSTLPFTAFGAGTNVADTEAKPVVWTEQPRFKEAAEKMQGEVSKLQAAARTGDEAQIKAAFGAAAKTCKACHDHFRNE